MSDISGRLGWPVVCFALGAAASQAVVAIAQSSAADIGDFLRNGFLALFEALRVMFMAVASGIMQADLTIVVPTLLLCAAVAGAALWRKKDRTSPTTAAEQEPSAEAKQQLSALKIEDELEEILRLIEAYIEANGRYAQSLIQSEANLMAETKPEQVVKIVRALLKEHHEVREEAQRLNSDLARSQGEIQRLTADLSQAQKESLRDSLTSVGNRRLFDLVLSEEILNARNRDSQLSLVIGDVDHFKGINDEYGHPMGDQILQHIAGLMKRSVRSRDTVARYGGEEFALVLPSCAQSDAFTLVEGIRKQLQQNRMSIAQTGKKIREVTASFGVTEYRKGEDGAQFLGRADANLLEAKRNGRNRTVAK
ncbi:MAG: diguanylate cyclase [Hyphomicrobiaceae bacterium]